MKMIIHAVYVQEVDGPLYQAIHILKNVLLVYV